VPEGHGYPIVTIISDQGEHQNSSMSVNLPKIGCKRTAEKTDQGYPWFGCVMIGAFFSHMIWHPVQKNSKSSMWESLMIMILAWADMLVGFPKEKYEVHVSIRMKDVQCSLHKTREMGATHCHQFSNSLDNIGIVIFLVWLESGKEAQN